MYVPRQTLSIEIKNLKSITDHCWHTCLEQKKRIGEKKKTVNSGLEIGSRLVASGDLKLTRATKSRGLNA